MYKHHNPKLAEPLLKELLEKLGKDWGDCSWHNEWTSSICHEYKEDNWCIISLPNSEKNDADEELVSEFYTWINLENGTSTKQISAKTVDPIFIKSLFTYPIAIFDLRVGDHIAAVTIPISFFCPSYKTEPTAGLSPSISNPTSFL